MRAGSRAFKMTATWSGSASFKYGSTNSLRRLSLPSRRIQNRSAPFFASVLEPISELVGDFRQSPLGHPFPLAVGIEETQHALGLLERLDQSIQQKPIEASIAELDAILVMFEKGVHGNLLCGEIPGGYRRGRLLVYAPAETRRPQLSRPVGVAQSARVRSGCLHTSPRAFPKQETYGLSLQMRRAAVSIPANIAEGFRRRGKADKARFMNMAEGSLEECRYYLILAQDLGYGDTRTGSRAARRSQPLLERLRRRHSDFWLLTSDFHIPKGYQGRSPWLVSWP